MNMNGLELHTPPVRRFDWIVRGEEAGPDSVCDLSLRSIAEAIAIPTIGAIVPNWVLAVPRMCAMSMADLAPDLRRKILRFGQELAFEMRGPGGAFFFEHGARVSGDVVGCGVDQAHLHVLVTGLDLLSLALADREVFWMEADVLDPWRSVGGSEYLFIQASEQAYVGHPRTSQSQYFRRLIARAAGVPSQWDYRVWPNYENVRRTYGRFGSRGAHAAKA
jgi:ATP adenylyltransferase